MTWFKWGESKKWYAGEVALKVGWVGNWAMEWSNLAAHRGLKRWLFWERKVVLCGFSIIYSYVSSILDCCGIMCWIGLCGYLDLEDMRSVSAMVLKFCGSNDKGWLWFRLCNCGAVSVAFVLFCESSYMFGVVDSLLLYSFIWASKSILINDLENNPKNPAKNMHATLACLFTCVSIAHVF